MYETYSPKDAENVRLARLDLASLKLQELISSGACRMGAHPFVIEINPPVFCGELNFYQSHDEELINYWSGIYLARWRDAGWEIEIEINDEEVTIYFEPK
jgi:hypothetical protein